MKKKIRNILILTLFLQLLIFFGQSSKSIRTEFNLNYGFSFESINLDDVTEFEIKDKSAFLKFDKKGQDWFFKANGERAHSEKIQKKLAKIKSIKAIRSVTESEVPPSGFNVDDNSYSKKITLTSAEPVVVFFGRSDKAGRSYLRIDGKQKIYEVAFVLDDLVTDPELWLVPESQQNQNDSELK